VVDVREGHSEAATTAAKEVEEEEEDVDKESADVQG
jgi:hypothetical protein